MLISAWLTSVRNRLQSSRVTKRRPVQNRAAQSSERLETRSLLTSPTLVAIRPNVGDILLEGQTRNVAPRELTLQFNPGQVIDATTLATGIAVTRAGNDGQFNGVNDVPVTIGFVGIGDHPEEVVVRFAADLPDDLYRVTIRGAGTGALRNSSREAFNNGVDLDRTFRLDLGAVVEGVVPQPVLRNKVVTIADVSKLNDADRLTITVASNSKSFEFNNSLLANGITGDYAVNFTPASQSSAVAAELANQINAAAMGVTATVSGSAVTLVGDVFTPGISPSLGTTGSVTLDAAGLVQRRDTVIVHFNEDDLNPLSAQNPSFYRLYDTAGTLITTDDTLLIPSTVTYDPTSNTAVLKFAADLPTATYSLRIGSNYDLSDKLSDATDIGTLLGSWNAVGFTGDGGAGANDVDLYRFNFTQGPAGFTANVTPQAGHAVVTRLFDNTGAQIIAGTSSLSVSLNTGTYYLGISSSGNASYDPVTATGASGGTTTGSYSVTLTGQNFSTADAGSSFNTAHDLGILGSGYTTPLLSIESQSIPLPPYPGGIDQPSHRDIPVEGESHTTSSGNALVVPAPILVVEYNFASVYGTDPQGNTLFNAITENQKQRAREVLEIWSKKAGIVVRETASSGLRIVTGDLRAFDPMIPPNAAAGMADAGMAIMNGNINWGASEYGGAWFRVAFHEIGHALGLEHAYDAVAIMGEGEDPSAPSSPPREPIFPTDIDIVNMQRIHRPDSTDIDLYRFQLPQNGSFSAEIFAERQASTLDAVLRLYDANRNLIAQNDNYFSGDSFIGMDLPAGTYYVGVSSTGNADYDPTIADTGFGGTTDGTYQLSLRFTAEKTSKLVDATGTEFDGDADGIAGGEHEFWFRSANTIFVDRTAANGGTGTLAAPYNRIDLAVAAATAGSIIRIVGNGGTDLSELTAEDALPYLVGVTSSGLGLRDGKTLDVPRGVTLMVDADAVIKLLSANIDVGTSAQGIDRSNGAVQILGVPNRPVYLTSYRNDALGGDSDGVAPAPAGGNWGGVVFRDDSDFESSGIFLNYVNKANISFGGGQVFVNSVLSVFSPIHMETARPTITFNTITNSAAAAVSANPNSFDDSLNRIGPDIHGNMLVSNSINGVFVRVRTLLGNPLDTLDVGARFDDTDIVHVISENVVITGNPGGSLNGVPRLSGRLAIDAGTVVKFAGSRIESLVGNSNIIAEGTAERPIVFTSLLDDQFGTGGTFDTSNNQSSQTAARGDWGGLVFNATSNGSIDHAILRYGGGRTPIEGDYDEFNVIEVHQATFRLTNSRLEFNASGTGSSGNSPNRNGRGDNSSATVFVRGAQPIIMGNEFRDNSSTGSFIISIDVNSLNSFSRPDTGRSTGLIQRDLEFDDNRGALVRRNLMRNNGINGMEVRGGVLTTQSIWDDTDIVHVLQSEIYSTNLHTYGGIRLQSGPTASLIVKLFGNTAGFTAGGVQQEIDDRIGGTVQIVGTPLFPVVLTSLRDDTVGAGFDLEGFPVLDTNNDGGATTAAPGNWRSLRLEQYSNDTNVRVVLESEMARTRGQDKNGTPDTAELLGTLAPNDKSGDDNRPVGFEVHGHVSSDAPTDADIYSFKANAGTEVWIDLDRTSSRLDSLLEVVLADGAVIAASDAGVLTGRALPLTKATALGGDYYTLNYMDEGFRMVLPGTTGSEGTYFVRVRSKAGLTSGGYQLQIRVNQRDEMPGSTVRFAELRFATNGIEMYGMPAHSPLSGEAAEANNSANNGFGGSEFIGDLLSSDRNTISVSGSLSSEADVDWYTFSVDYQFIQAIAGINAGGKTWATIFDIDYADGLARPDTILSVYDNSGRLMFVSRDSDIIDDQPAPGSGQNVDDLSRGTVGKLDPFIGTVQLPERNDQRYRVAISSNGRMPAELSQFFIANPSDQLSRLEPVNSLRRIVEDHIGFQGYSTNGQMGPVPVPPENTSGLFNISTATRLNAYVKPFTLSDVSLFANSGNRLFIANPFTGAQAVNVGAATNYGDIAMRPDGNLYGMTNGTTLQLINPATGAGTTVGNTGIPIFQGNANASAAMAFRRPSDQGPGSYELYVAQNSNWDADGANNNNEAAPSLFRLNPNSGAAIDENSANGFQAVGLLPAGAIITGLAFSSISSNTLYAVDSVGGLWRTSVGGNSTTRGIGGWTQISADVTGAGVGATGITLGPQNVEDGAYADVFFVTGTNGRLYAFRVLFGVVVPQPIFDTDVVPDGVADSTSTALLGGVMNGLAFSPLDFNLWHPTMRRGSDLGHGINDALDNSRATSASRGINGRTTSESQGGASFYFGLEGYAPGNTNAYFEYAGQGGQLGVLNGAVQEELSTNAAVANTYNLPGGAYGSLVSNAFSLEGYTATERPVLYFNYFLATEGANAADNTMRDSARAYVSSDGGVSWTLVATNNSARNPLTSELPAYASHSATQTPTDARQVVQELFDNTGTWRQARIDLGPFAGQSRLQLRFDFSTSGKSNDPTVDGVGFGNLASGLRSANNSFEGFFVDDIVIGFANRGEMATTSATGNLAGSMYTAPLDPSGIMQQLQGEYQLEIRRGTEFASTVSPLGPQIGIVPGSLITAKQRLVSEYALTVPSASVIQDGDSFTIDNGIFQRTFEFDLGGGVTAPNIPVSISTGMSKGQVANALAAAINSQSGVSFSSDSATWFNVKATTRPAARNSDIVDLTGAVGVTTAPIAAPADLTVSITAASVLESTPSQNFTVTRTGSTAADLTVTVQALNPAGGATTEAQVTNGISTGTSITVTIPAGSSSITLQLLPTNDTLIDGPQPVLVRATAAGFNSISDVVDINDNDGLPISRSLEVQLLQTVVRETDGNGRVTGYVTLPDPLTPGDFDAYDGATPLTVTIVSTDGSEITSTSTSFVDGQYRATFAMNVVDEFFANGNTTVTIFVTAPGYSSVSRTVTVNEAGSVNYAERLGDRNLERRQGMVIVESNIIRNVQGYGVIADAAPRSAGNQPHAGPVRNLAVLNSPRLVPGVTIRNNVVANLGTGGILFSGDTNPANQPLAPVPFGKIVNNTIYGGGTAGGTGIRVEQNASPTLVNNILANTAVGIFVDPSSASTVVGSNLFQGNTSNGTTGSDAFFPPASAPLFINAALNNYYLASGSLAIDSALNKLADRPAFTAVKDPLAIPPSDLVAPLRDLYGQLRQDDPSQPTPPGLGSDIFKDRGAIERADFEGPFAKFAEPADDNGLADLDNGLTRIHVDNLLFPTTLAIDLLDNGVGVDDLLVNSAQFRLTQNGVLLTENVDYVWRYNPSTNRVFFISVTTFPTDTRYAISIDNTTATGVRDLAGNTLAANQTDGTTIFTVLLTDGVNDAPVHTNPAAGTQSTNEDVTLVFSAANNNLISLYDEDAYLGRPEANPAFNQDDGILVVTLTATNGTLTLSGVAGLNFSAASGGVGDGTDDVTMTFTGAIRDINVALSGMGFAPAADYFGSASITITSRDLGNFGPPPLNPRTTTTSFDINVLPVNDSPVFNPLPTPPAIDEDSGLVTINGFMTGQVAGPSNETPPQTLTAQLTVQSVTGRWTTATFFAQAPVIDPVTGTLTFQTAQDVNGTATIRVVLTDNGTPAASSVPQTFVITVNPVNDIPVFTPSTTDSRVDVSGNITTLEDAGLQTITYPATFAAARPTALDEVGSQTPLVWSISAATLVTGNLDFTSLTVDSATGVLRYNTTQDTAGSATILLTLTDSGSGIAPNINTATRTVTINVAPVNDAPVAKTGNYVVDEGYEIALNASMSFDVDAPFGDFLTRYEWDLNNDGIYETDAGNSPTLTLPWSQLSSLGITAPAVRTIGLRVTDNSGLANNRGTTTATLTTLIVDYADAPDSYGTLRASSGAAHTITGNLFLGAGITKEQDGQPSAAANLDTDDGVSFPTFLEATPLRDLPAYVDVTASAAARLDIWLDRIGAGFGVFDTSEHLNGGVSYAVTAGLNRIHFTIAAGTVTGDSIMRFRLSTAGSLAPTGRASDGEVEDYLVTIRDLQTPVTPTIDGPAAVTTDLAPTVTWTLHPENYNYDVVVTNSANVVVFSRTGTTFNFARIAPPLPAGTVYPLPAGIYTETVIAYNKVGDAATAATRQFQITSPQVTAPTGSVTSRRPQITWNAVSNAASYGVQLFNLTDNTLVSSVIGITATNWTPSADLVLAEYEARVTAFNSASQGSSVGVRRFTVAPAPVAVAPSGRLPDATPSFGWNSVPGANRYELIVRQVFGAGTTVISESTLVTTAFTQPTPLPLGRYTYTIRAINDPSNGSVELPAFSTPSVVGQFTITERPIVVNPPATTFLNRPEITWTVPLGAGATPISDIWVNKVENGRSVVYYRANAVSGTSHTPDVDFVLGTYQVYVRTYSAVDPASASDWSFPKTVRVTTAPTLVAPIGRVFSINPTLTWEGVPGAQSYRVYLSCLSTGNTVLYDVSNINALSFAIPESLPLARYRYWVQARSAFGDLSNWSRPGDFSVVAAPVLSGPSSSTFDNTPSFSWTSLAGLLNGTIPAGATAYDLRIDQVFSTSVVVGYQTYTVSTTSVTVPDNQALPIGTYRARIRARSADVQGDYSVMLEFYVGGRPIVRSIPPSNNQQPTITWGAVDGAASYEIYISNANDPTRALVRVSGLTVNSFTPETPLASGILYRVWLRALNSATSTYSAWSVPVDMLITDAATTQPLDGATGEWVLTATDSLLDPLPNEYSISMLPSRIGTTQPIPQEATADETVAPAVLPLNAADVAPVDPTAQPADTDAVLSGWNQEAWWDRPAAAPDVVLPTVESVEARKPNDRQSASAGILGALLGLASLRRRRRNDDSEG